MTDCPREYDQLPGARYLPEACLECCPVHIAQEQGIEPPAEEFLSGRAIARRLGYEWASAERDTHGKMFLIRTGKTRALRIPWCAGLAYLEWRARHVKGPGRLARPLQTPELIAQREQYRHTQPIRYANARADRELDALQRLWKEK